MFYLIKPPRLIKHFYKACLWDMPKDEKKIYLSFDDGPHPVITPFVLDLLKQYNARASFFCIGKNVELFPEIYRRIIEEGHAVGNHTYSHVKGSKVSDRVFLADIEKAAGLIDTNLFRPPYGRISKFQVNALQSPRYTLKTVMWSLLSGDFDTSIYANDCAQNVILNAKSGSIVVFHDSEKAWPRLEYALPEVLKFFTLKGYLFDKIIIKKKG